MPITATNKLSREIREVNAPIQWKMIVNPGGSAEKALPMGNSGPHKIYVTYDDPRNPGAKKELKPTVVRMDLAVEKVGFAFENAKTKAGTQTPTLQRLVYEVVRLHKFHLYNTIVGDRGAAYGWFVPYYWTHKYPSRWYDDPANYQVGGDCISGAVFASFATLMVGIPGTIEAKAYMSKSPTEPTKAVEWVRGDPARVRVGAGGRREYLQHFDYGVPPGGNNFEAAIVYTTPGGNTFYFPAGTSLAYDNPDNFLTVFQSFGWARWEKDPTQPTGGKWVMVEKKTDWDGTATSVSLD